jgi:hypothetical protein
VVAPNVAQLLLRGAQVSGRDLVIIESDHTIAIWGDPSGLSVTR